MSDYSLIYEDANVQELPPDFNAEISLDLARKLARGEADLVRHVRNWMGSEAADALGVAYEAALVEAASRYVRTTVGDLKLAMEYADKEFEESKEFAKFLKELELEQAIRSAEHSNARVARLKAELKEEGNE